MPGAAGGPTPGQSATAGDTFISTRITDALGNTMYKREWDTSIVSYSPLAQESISSRETCRATPPTSRRGPWSKSASVAAAGESAIWSALRIEGRLCHSQAEDTIFRQLHNS
eukprot:842747-Amphidinium_carterae.2